MVYRRTHQVVKRLAARRNAILAAARETAAESGMAGVQIAPVAVRANVAAGTVYRYFPSKADLISELIADVSRDELAAVRRAADGAPGPSSALAAAISTIALHVVSQRKLAWGILAEPVDVVALGVQDGQQRAGLLSHRVLDQRRLMQLRLPQGLLDPAGQLVDTALPTSSAQSRGDTRARQPGGRRRRERGCQHGTGVATGQVGGPVAGEGGEEGREVLAQQ